MNTKPFKQAYCDYYKCAPEQYMREVFLRCLHARAHPFGWFLYWMGAAESLELLEEAGKTTSHEELLDVILQLKYDAHERGRTLAHRWKFCVSGKCLLQLDERIRK